MKFKNLNFYRLHSQQSNRFQLGAHIEHSCAGSICGSRARTYYCFGKHIKTAEIVNLNRPDSHRRLFCFHETVFIWMPFGDDRRRVVSWHTVFQHRFILQHLRHFHVLAADKLSASKRSRHKSHVLILQFYDFISFSDGIRRRRRRLLCHHVLLPEDRCLKFKTVSKNTCYIHTNTHEARIHPQRVTRPNAQ